MDAEARRAHAYFSQRHQLLTAYLASTDDVHIKELQNAATLPAWEQGLRKHELYVLQGKNICLRSALTRWTKLSQRASMLVAGTYKSTRIGEAPDWRRPTLGAL